LFVCLIGAFVFIVAGTLLLLPFSSSDAMDILSGSTSLNDPDNLGIARYMQILSHLGMFIVPSVVLAYWFGRKISGYLYLHTLPSRWVFLLSALLIFAVVPFINFIYEWNMQMHFPEGWEGLENWMRRSEEAAEQVTHMFLDVHTVGGLLFNLFMIALIPAIGEELMFRGVLFRIFHQWTSSTHIAVWLTAILFSAIHLQFFGFLPRMVLGVLFGYLVVITGSLWPAMIAHFVNNGAAVIFYYIYGRELSENAFENMGKGTTGIYYALVSVAITVLIFVFLKKKSKNKQILQSE
jgi:membrane protease YdiL (CAAX protease family)